jgi:uncharacterized protein
MVRYAKKVKKTSWIPLVRSVHWISSAICLVAIFLFSVTGFILNNIDVFKTEPKTFTIERTLPETLLTEIAGKDVKKIPLPIQLMQWFENETTIDIQKKEAEWKSDEIILKLSKPGTDVSLSIQRETGQWIYKNSARGWIAYFNDLHKGRNTGKAWRWFIDFVAVCCFIFSLSGFWLLWRYSANRPATYPLLVAGVIVPWVILILSVHLSNL